MQDADLDEATSGYLANLGAWLRTARNHPHAANVGELLCSHWPASGLELPKISDVDLVLAELARRYQTPIPEAYLGESFAIAQRQRRQHGVFYTPWPLAQYLMRSAAELIAREFPNESPTWLDPACGGGVFFQSLLSDNRIAPGDLLGLENSPVATALCQAITQARGFGSTRRMNIECRDALLCSPDELFQGKQTAPLIVVGNPPYSNFGKRPLSNWLDQELLRYRSRSDEKKTNLRDAFLLFLRLAESLITARGRGILAMVLSTTFLDAITHAQVRNSLLSTFDELHILRLESSDDPAHNLFSIRQTTAACLFVRKTNHDPNSPAQVFQSVLSGTREQKLGWLTNHTSQSTEWQKIAIDNDTSERGNQVWSETQAPPKWYSAAPSLPEIFQKYVSGVQTKNDALFLARSRSRLEEQIRSRFGVFDPAYVQTILVGPFDPWWIYYDPNLLGRARYPVMRHMLKENLGLVFMRQATSAGEYDHFLVTRHLVTDRVFHSRWGAPFLAPLYRWENESKCLNISAKSSEGWLAYAYGWVHSTWFRGKVADSLRRDFPRIPPPELFSSEIVERLTQIGQSLIELHAPRDPLQRSSANDEEPTHYHVAARYPKTEPIGDSGGIYTSRDQVLATLPMEIWRYRIGGVEILERFLLRRRGEALLKWEVDHFHQVATVLERTLLYRGEIDSLELNQYLME